MKLTELIGNLQPKQVWGDFDLEISGIAYDSRQVKQKCLFVCVQGLVTDGHKFLNDAISRGAKALIISKEEYRPADFSGTVVLVEDSRRALSKIANDFYKQPSKKLKLIGITGTNGKTTTAYLLAAILRAAGKKVGMMGTIEYQIGDKKIPASRTTPESLDLQEFLAKMLAEGCEYAVMEVSSHSLEMGRVKDCYFSGAVFTNLTPEHLDFHPDMESYFLAKQKLFLHLEAQEVAVTNLDDKYGRRMVEGCKAKVLTYSRSKEADVSLKDYEVGDNGMQVTLLVNGERRQMQSPLLGDYNLDNLMAAVAMGISQDIEWSAIVQGIAEVISVSGRFEPVRCGQDFNVIVDYAHTEDALSNLLKAARRQTEGRVITVFGCGGDRDKSKRSHMGAVATQLSDFVVITSDNPRSEDPMLIIKQIETGVLSAGGTEETYLICPDRRQAIEEAVKLAKKQDIVVIAGKGHETYQLVGGKTLSFDDRAVAREVIKNLFASQSSFGRN